MFSIKYLAFMTFCALYSSVLYGQNMTPDVYQEENGIVMIEIEYAPLTNPGNWIEAAEAVGFTGSSYYIPTGGGGTDETHALAYQILITTPGNYRLGLHNWFEHDSVTEDNDSFCKFDDEPWIKTWSHRMEIRNRGVWTWETGMDPGGDNLRLPVFENLAAGEHVFYIAYRSPNWALDRFYLTKVDYGRDQWVDGRWDTIDTVSLHDLSHPLSPVVGETGFDNGIIMDERANILTSGQLLPTATLTVSSVSIHQPQSGLVAMTVYGIDGSVVHEISERFLNKGNHAVSLPGSGLARGMYLCAFSTRAGPSFRSVPVH